ncbi:MAG: hypothetical protein AAGA48_39510 [Myxococcota bacterium]
MITEGIRTSNRPLGPLAKRWLSAVRADDERMQGRMRRGRTLAKSGRVRSIDFAPGTVYAEVEDGSMIHRPTVRIRTYDEDEWKAVLDVLRQRLDRLAALVEGDINASFLKALQSQGVKLFPEPGELDGDCDCGDYAVPCAHGAAVHHLIAEALEGEPLLLFALRGRPREQLIAELRRSWGDTSRSPSNGANRDETPPPGDWFASPGGAPSFSISVRQDGPYPPGLLELGPLPGNGDLLKTFAPLYEAGSAAAIELALAEPARGRRTKRVRRAHPAWPSTPIVAKPIAIPEPKPQKAEREDDLGERLVNLLADAEDGASTKQLATTLDLDPILVRRELVELEILGVVARTGSTRATRWWLG